VAPLGPSHAETMLVSTRWYSGSHPAWACNLSKMQSHKGGLRIPDYQRCRM
jgi:hypothetical protein